MRSGEKSQMLEAPQKRWFDVLSVLSTYLKGTELVKHAFELARSNLKSMESSQKCEDYRKPKHCEDPNLYRSTHSCPCLERSPLSEFFGRYSS